MSNETIIDMDDRQKLIELVVPELGDTFNNGKITMKLTDYQFYRHRDHTQNKYYRTTIMGNFYIVITTGIIRSLISAVEILTEVTAACKQSLATVLNKETDIIKEITFTICEEVKPNDRIEWTFYCSIYLDHSHSRIVMDKIL